MSANGQLTPSELTTVQGTIQLSVTTARAWEKMKSDAANQGITLVIAAPAGGYRDLAMQRDMHANPGKYNITPGVGLLPVGLTKHGLGIDVDVAGGSGLTFVLQYGSQYGFTRPLAFDPNHFEHDGTTAAGLPANPIKMARRKRKKTMTDILWYVPKASTDKTVSIKAGTAWYQRSPGAAVVQLDANGVVGQSSEYTALARQNYRMNDGSPGHDDNPEALANFYTEINGDDLLKLIAVRGLVPVYDENGNVSDGTPITDQTAILKAIAAIPTADENGAAARSAIVK